VPTSGSATRRSTRWSTRPQCTKIAIRAGANTRGEHETVVYQNCFRAGANTRGENETKSVPASLAKPVLTHDGAGQAASAARFLTGRLGFPPARVTVHPLPPRQFTLICDSLPSSCGVSPSFCDSSPSFRQSLPSAASLPHGPGAAARRRRTAISPLAARRTRLGPRTRSGPRRIACCIATSLFRRGEVTGTTIYDSRTKAVLKSRTCCFGF
jgi:hypothetical protein